MSESFSNTHSDRVSGWWTALATWIAGCVLGLGGFVYAGNQLKEMENRLWAAVLWQLVFGIGLALIVGVIAIWLRRRGESLAVIGWRQPTSKTAMACGVMLGLLYTLGVYAGIMQDPQMQGVNPLAWHWMRLALVPVGIGMAFAEEAMMRGFFMNELARVRVPAWGQILLSGVCSGIYHSFHNWSWLGLIPGVMLFTIHAALYVAARRSLTPSVIAHSIYHVLGAPYLLMYAMGQIPE